MCKNATRAVTWKDASKINLEPVFVVSDSTSVLQGVGTTIELTVAHITEQEDYRIFDHMRTGNITAALDMIEQHKGINAVDEWGQTSLMMAVQLKKLEVVASLLNTRMPKVNVNAAKSVGEKSFSSPYF